MSFAIKQGLFKLNIIDHHAILGVSIDAEPKQIRLQYLKIAQQLHPDKCRNDPAKGRTAQQILSRLVNPAYEQLSRKSAFAEHQLVLTQIGKRLAENKDNIHVKNPLAQELLKAGDSAELVYPKLLKELSAEQYQSLAQSGEIIEAISELNLVYVMLQSDRRINRNRPQVTPEQAKPNPEKVERGVPSQASKATLAQEPSPVAPIPVEEPTIDSRVNAFVNRAQQYIAKGEFDRGIQELKDALRINPNHGVAHAVMGKAYLLKKQLTMAKVHIDKAWQASPHNEQVIESKKALDRLSKAANQSKTSHPGGDSKTSDKNNKPGTSGFLSGFFSPKKSK
jgi:tetratricopeptide (TPR) repeat protein